jgi:hypothetical protein
LSQINSSAGFDAEDCTVIPSNRLAEGGRAVQRGRRWACRRRRSVTNLAIADADVQFHAVPARMVQALAGDFAAHCLAPGGDP